MHRSHCYSLPHRIAMQHLHRAAEADLKNLARRIVRVATLYLTVTHPACSRHECYRERECRESLPANRGVLSTWASLGSVLAPGP